ncbi:MAG TPA: bacteriohemerythrin [Candidatus Omnitrophota bacterium]|nr:bacteriohemerythrin [Candidatus Omnitrophota bacterium]
MAITWDASFSVNVREIDDQHRKLFDIFNRLLSGMGTQDRDFIGGAIGEMVDYSKYHFSTEERYMELFRYPQYAKHKKEHDDFIAKVEDFIGKWNDKKAALSLDVMFFLENWIRDHTQGIDKELGPFLNQNHLF